LSRRRQERLRRCIHGTSIMAHKSACLSDSQGPACSFWIGFFLFAEGLLCTVGRSQGADAHAAVGSCAMHKSSHVPTQLQARVMNESINQFTNHRVLSVRRRRCRCTCQQRSTRLCTCVCICCCSLVHVQRERAKASEQVRISTSRKTLLLDFLFLSLLDSWGPAMRCWGADLCPSVAKERHSLHSVLPSITRRRATQFANLQTFCCSGSCSPPHW
jgi:hypothetical protein